MVLSVVRKVPPSLRELSSLPTTVARSTLTKLDKSPLVVMSIILLRFLSLMIMVSLGLSTAWVDITLVCPAKFAALVVVDKIASAWRLVAAAWVDWVTGALTGSAGRRPVAGNLVVWLWANQLLPKRNKKAKIFMGLDLGKLFGTRPSRWRDEIVGDVLQELRRM